MSPKIEIINSHALYEQVMKQVFEEKFIVLEKPSIWWSSLGTGVLI